MPARKKNPAVRARANRASTARTMSRSAVLPAARRPRLPVKHDARGKIQAWHPEAKAFWDRVWSSPQAATFPQVARSELLLVTLTVDKAWRSDTLTAITAAVKMVDAVLEKHGLTPYGMLRLEWQFEETDAAKAAGARRRSTAAPPAPSKGKGEASDPRRHLSAV